MKAEKDRYIKDAQLERFTTQQETTRQGLEVLVSLKKLKLPYSLESLIEGKIQKLVHSIQPGNISEL